MSRHAFAVAVAAVVVVVAAVPAFADAPPAWTCDGAYFADGAGCDCGCGAVDPDCRDGSLGACDFNGCAAGVPARDDVTQCAENACGDGWVDGTERCDDGDAVDGGGCSADCRSVEAGFACGPNGEGCRTKCGDAVVEFGREQCDDGNNADGDGCDSTCHAEDGYVCNGGFCYVPTCGDGFVDFDYVARTGEDCDDGNNVDGDGCDAACKTEPGFVCDSFDTGCRAVTCGDGVWEFDYETLSGEGCDDGNTVSGDGCSSTCTVEDGFICDGSGTPCARAVCGDGVTQFNYSNYTGEQCDDGNDVAGDGCFGCVEEPGFICVDGAGCHPIVCGDGLQDFDPFNGFYEQCDDGNGFDHDGCSHDCLPEPGFQCLAPGEACTPVVCGDGVVEVDTFTFAQEGCDDGNADGGDGCSATCTVEPGFVCPSTGGACRVPVCGDLVLEGDEDCDDGNDVDGDGCSACHTDPGFYCAVIAEPCTPIPAEWTCSGAFYGTGDGCDCGCGAVDADCADGSVASCDFDQCFTSDEVASSDDPTTCVAANAAEGEGAGAGEGEGEGEGAGDGSVILNGPTVEPIVGCASAASPAAPWALALALVAIRRSRGTARAR